MASQAGVHHRGRAGAPPVLGEGLGLLLLVVLHQLRQQEVHLPGLAEVPAPLGEGGGAGEARRPALFPTQASK